MIPNYEFLDIAHGRAFFFLKKTLKSQDKRLFSLSKNAAVWLVNKKWWVRISIMNKIHILKIASFEKVFV